MRSRFIMDGWAVALITLLAGLFVMIIHKGSSMELNNKYDYSKNMNKFVPNTLETTLNNKIES